MKRETHHVVPTPENDWKVIKGGSEKAIKLFDTKQKAIEYARTISQNQGTELVIHKKDGTIQNSDSHGNDPFPPRDTK